MFVYHPPCGGMASNNICLCTIPQLYNLCTIATQAENASEIKQNKCYYRLFFFFILRSPKIGKKESTTGKDTEDQKLEN